jgi:hypothetical protein
MSSRSKKRKHSSCLENEFETEKEKAQKPRDHGLQRVLMDLNIPTVLCKIIQQYDELEWKTLDVNIDGKWLFDVNQLKVGDSMHIKITEIDYWFFERASTYRLTIWTPLGGPMLRVWAVSPHVDVCVYTGAYRTCKHVVHNRLRVLRETQ